MYSVHMLYNIGNFSTKEEFPWQIRQRLAIGPKFFLEIKSNVQKNKLSTQ